MHLLERFQRCGVYLAILCAVLLPLGTRGQSCIDDFEEIYRREAGVTNTAFPRMYILCPRRIYEVGYLDFDYNLIQPPVGNAAPPLPLRPNVTIRCGDQGSRENMCWVTGGDIQIDGTNILGIGDETLDNVRIEGIVFIGALEHSLWANKPGSITFRDCEFRDFTNSTVPIMLDYFDSYNPSAELSTTFLDCEFTNNTYWGSGSQSALIYSNSVQNRITVLDSLFVNNDMVSNNTRPDTHSYIIESLGPVEVKTTCFMDNLVGSSNVVVFGNTFRSDQNYVSDSSGVLCPFSSVFETVEQFDAFEPTCVEATETICNRYVTLSPTETPSQTPTVSSPPSSVPTGTPSISSQPTISSMPTGEPSTAPSAMPSKHGTTKQPSAAPTESKLEFVWPTVSTDAPSAAPASAGVGATTMLLVGSTALWCLYL